MIKKKTWGNVVAHASSTPEHKIWGRDDIKSPYISLNPEIKTSFIGALINTSMSKRELSGVLFHEMIHNLGYRHSYDIELAYGCEACCFQTKKGDRGDALACKICRGGYTSTKDSKYLSDLARFSAQEGFVAAELNFYGNISDIEASDQNANSLLISMYNKDDSILNALYQELTGAGHNIDEEFWGPKVIGRMKSYHFKDKQMEKSTRSFAKALVTMLQTKDIQKASTYLREIDLKYLLRELRQGSREAQALKTSLSRFAEILSYDSRYIQYVRGLY